MWPPSLHWDDVHVSTTAGSSDLSSGKRASVTDLRRESEFDHRVYTGLLQPPTAHTLQAGPSGNPAEAMGIKLPVRAS